MGRLHTAEANQKNREAHLGERNSMFGTHHSMKTRMKMSEANKGKIAGEKHPNFEKHLQPGTRRKISDAQLGERGYWFGKHRTQETKTKISEAISGKHHPMFGKHLTYEVRQILREKSVIQKGHYPKKDTSIERALQDGLRKVGIINFETDKPIKAISRADVFILPNVCIYADGDYWHNISDVAQRDKKQTEQLAAEGYIVLRFCEAEIEKNLDECISRIVLSLEKLI